MKKRRFTAPVIASLAACLPVTAQDRPKNAPTKEQLAHDNKLFIALATKNLKWDEPTDAVHIVGPLYFVAFPDGGGFNPGYRVAGKTPSYPGIEDDHRQTLHTLEMLKPDIWAGHHTEYFDLEGKRKRAASEGAQAWVDPEGYRQFIAGKRKAFDEEVDAEMAAPGPASHADRPSAGTHG